MKPSRRYAMAIIMGVLLFFVLTGCNGQGSGELVPLGETGSTETTVQNHTVPPAESGTERQQEEQSMKIEIQVGNARFTAVLYDNETARALAARLPLELSMRE